MAAPRGPRSDAPSAIIAASSAAAIGPAIIFLNRIANAVLRHFGLEPRDEVTGAFTRDEEARLVADSRREGLLGEGEEQLVASALQFEDRDITSVASSDRAVETVPTAITPAQLEEVAGRTGYSPLPVRRGDDLVGYLHLKDVFELEDVHGNRSIAPSWSGIAVPWNRPMNSTRCSAHALGRRATEQHSALERPQSADSSHARIHGIEAAER